MPNLILPGVEIIDPAALLRSIAAEIGTADDARAARAIAVRHLAAAKARGNAALAEAFAARPLASRALTRAQVYLTDGLVTTALRVAQGHLQPSTNPTDAERLAVLGVGGYGRAEMAPHSDVDLLFLTPWKITPWAESVIESLL